MKSNEITCNVMFGEDGFQGNLRFFEQRQEVWFSLVWFGLVWFIYSLCTQCNAMQCNAKHNTKTKTKTREGCREPNHT